MCRRLRCWLVVLAVWGLAAAGCSSGAPSGAGGSPVGDSAPAPPVAVEGGIEASGGVTAPSSTAASSAALQSGESVSPSSGTDAPLSREMSSDENGLEELDDLNEADALSSSEEDSEKFRSEDLGEEDTDKLLYAAYYGRPDDITGAPDSYIAARAFYLRALIEGDPYGIDLIDRSTPEGTLCWIMMRVLVIPWWWTEARLYSIQLWHYEQEAANRLIELPWETSWPLDYPTSFRSVLLEVTASEVRDTVLSSGLLPPLHWLARIFFASADEHLSLADEVDEALADEVDEVDESLFWSTPEAEDLALLPGLEEITEEEIIQIWPTDFDIYADVFVILEQELVGQELEVLSSKYSVRDEGVAELSFSRADIAELLGADCRFRSLAGQLERSCPPWVEEALPSRCWIPENTSRWVCPFHPLGDCESTGE